jgi:hypothetical protein
VDHFLLGLGPWGAWEGPMGGPWQPIGGPEMVPRGAQEGPWRVQGGPSRALGGPEGGPVVAPKGKGPYRVAGKCYLDLKTWADIAHFEADLANFGLFGL